MKTSEDRKKIGRLRVLGELLLDARLATLKSAVAARRASLDRLADLDRPDTATGLSEMATAEVGLRYQKWADLRRAEINLTLARQTATWIEAREEAARAFGRAQALDRLAKPKT